MILQALNEYYNALEARGGTVRRGWSPAKVSFALVLDRQGALVDLLPLKQTVPRGQKMVEIPTTLEVPQQSKRAVNIQPNFLADNSSYFLGADTKGKPERAHKCFEASRALHEQLLAGLDDPAAQAVCAFFAGWDPAAAAEHPVLQPYWQDVAAASNLVFRFGGMYVQQNKAICAVWDQAQDHGERAEEGLVQGRCLVTGQWGPVARLHPVIKGVRNAQSSGASLVSFNTSALESYGKEQSYNAPVSQGAAFAYAAALNQLLADGEHVQQMGDTTVVYWAQNGDPFYPSGFTFELDPSAYVEESDIARALDALAHGRTYEWEGRQLSPDMRFYVLGLSPNAARLSVRFFYCDSFGPMLERIERHYARLQIARPSYDERANLSIKDLLDETVNQKAQRKEAAPILVGGLFRAVLEDGPYPAALYNSVLIRVRADHKVTRGRAAICKAYLLKRLETAAGTNTQAQREVLSVELNEQSAYIPYVLGRLFALLERLQQAANPGINATIRDKYFNMASTNPAVVFPQLMRLAGSHLHKLEKGQAVYYDKQIQELMARMVTAYPKHMDLQDQGIFQIGYYHQTQKMFTKKEERENV